MKKVHFTTPMADIEKNTEELASYSNLREFLVNKIAKLKRGNKEWEACVELLNILDLSAATVNCDWDATGALYFHLS